jgi:hypothetical protein
MPEKARQAGLWIARGRRDIAALGEKAEQQTAAPAGEVGLLEIR